ncbi:MAG: NADH:ubiquinone oxidoreductase subunit NDUFA12 [Cohaesibacter sp.]|nr:NADH:ubiquinone oxidoreductase subunit NDUFA12 [Cohaesibacter sp.]MCV6600711.1 NADH:ubiquinone oxidoreductase subunit NDUFA12 [Cohaesibacter sp.]
MKKYLLLILTWWGNTTIGTMFHTWRHGVYVGKDQFGNTYYKQDVSNNAAYSASRKGERRWVIYAKEADASAIPSGWHGWMHHRTDLPPSQDDYIPREWEKQHQPNMTGTPKAYHPDGSILTPDRRPNVSGDYEAWRP